MRLWDISPTVDANSALFTGDTPYRERWHFTIDASCPVNVREITLSPHTGAHADAPLHYSSNGAPIGELALAPYIGACRVIHAIDCGPLIEPRHLQDHLADLPPRVLVRTSIAASQTPSPAMSAFAPESLDLLASLGVQLVGIDTASVDPANSQSLDAHHRLLRFDMRVLENLVLDEVQAGDYELIALPLKLRTADASPVRAILRELT